MGTLPESQTLLYKENKKFKGITIPQLGTPVTLEGKFKNLISSEALRLMQEMLSMEIEKRLTAKECLEHPYFSELRDEEEKKKLKE